MQGYEDIQRVLSALESAGVGEDLMLIGARARDILHERIVGGHPMRATKDVDIAIYVDSWHDLEAINANFERCGSAWQKRLVGNLPVDFVPFGPIESPPGEISPSDGLILNVNGLREAFSTSLKIDLNNGRVVRIPSKVGFLLLKLEAWLDRFHISGKDGSDIATAISWFDEQEYLLGDEFQAMLLDESLEFDPIPQRVAIIGFEVAKLLGEEKASALALRFHELQEPELNRLAGQLHSSGAFSVPQARLKQIVPALLFGMRTAHSSR
ncbi:hypothetical protein [Corynebacterium epidermidicanis]|uniref:Nucleotidyltransferase n=1 Tax=Corynebacterium epidermidicanis TaxID=1050174 RepID=A0A0G3GSW1_9CORY|nr:hypothetical protein [Corynebacterium epidermidicanis]AKK04271.1 hypothetical protein CEPID_12240 [Corynebacterium epidermidicanis]